MENWRDVIGYEGRYQVSNEGKVKSLNYHHTGQEKLLKPQKRRDGYLQVYLCKEGKVKMYFIHRLVWNAFNGKIPDGLQVNHIDENKENNRIDNLNLMTPKENTNWGTCVERRTKRKSKQVIGKDEKGNVLYIFPSANEAGRNGFDQGNISECCRGKRNKHKGLYWDYA